MTENITLYRASSVLVISRPRVSPLLTAIIWEGNKKISDLSIFQLFLTLTFKVKLLGRVKIKISSVYVVRESILMHVTRTVSAYFVLLSLTHLFGVCKL